MTTEIAEYSPTEQALGELRQKYATVVFDVTTTKGMTAAKEARAELRTIRTTLEKKRVEIKAPALERCRLIDTEAKRITAELAKLEDPIDEAIKAEEARKEAERAEKARQAEEAARAIRAKLDAIRQRPLTVIGKAASTIAKLIEDTRALEFSDLPEQHQAEAIRLRDGAIEQLVTMHTERVAADAEAQRLAAERAELERVRDQQEAEQAEHDRVAREEREAQEAAQRERIAAQERELAAERQRLADEEAERQRLAQAERDKLAAERAEFQRKQDEAARIERERQEAAQRETERQRVESERAERQRAIDSATLREAAGEAVTLLQNEGFGEHITTLKLAAALAREVNRKPSRRAA